MNKLKFDNGLKIGKLTFSRKQVINISVIILAFLAVLIMSLTINNHGKIACTTCLGSKTTYSEVDVCPICNGEKQVIVDGAIVECENCAGTGEIDCEGRYVECPDCEGTGEIEVENRYQGTIMSLLPPVIAIVLALVTKEVYSSLFIGILAGALFNGQYNFATTMEKMISDGFIGSLADEWNMGIILFLVILGAVVSLVNTAGGAEAFGKWAKTHIKTAVGASLATFILGVLIFIDDYFNCLTVGSVMRPVTDNKKISREKLAYLIDATAAPVCMIAPISSWAAAVSSTANQVGTNGIHLFISAIPYNFYSLLTIVMILSLIFLRVDFGPMKKYEQAAKMLKDIDETKPEEKTTETKSRSKVIDLLIPIGVLIVCCVIGMLYSGGFFDATSGNHLKLIGAFGDTDASFGLSWGSVLALIIIMIYFSIRRLLSFKQTMESLTKGFCAMVPAILILTFAWTLNTMTSSLGAAGFVGHLMNGAAEGLKMMLPAIIFLVALGLAFATGTSWGTFGILIPIVVAVFGANGGQLLTIGISACLAGAVCGDHCSPISDTTIMASAGAQCDHVNHVSSQLPYALTAAAVSFVSFILAGLIQMWYVVLPIGIILMVGAIFGIKYIQKAIDSKKVAVADGDGALAETAQNDSDNQESEIIAEKDDKE